MIKNINTNHNKFINLEQICKINESCGYHKFIYFDKQFAFIAIIP